MIRAPGRLGGGGRGGAPGGVCAVVPAAVWPSPSPLPVATASRPSPVCPPRPFFPTCQRKKAGRRGSKKWGQGASAPRTPRRVTGCSFCRGAWLRSCALSSGHEANASEMRTQNLLCARLQRGRRVVVWLVLIYVFVFKLLHDGARQRSRLFNKSIRGLDTWGPAVTCASPLRAPKSTKKPFSSQETCI